MLQAPDTQRTFDWDQHSSYWKDAILDTIPEWNKLSDSTVKVDSISIFKSQLATARILCELIGRCVRGGDLSVGWQDCAPHILNHQWVGVGGVLCVR